MNKSNLNRFLEPQNKMYDIALFEVKRGKKTYHWMWFVFPQIKGLGKSSTSNYYAIQNKQEAIAYLKHPILGKRLIEITKALLEVNGKTAFTIFGTPDYLKLKSCMTLFKAISKPNSIFKQVIDSYYYGFQDELTIFYLEEENE